MTVTGGAKPSLDRELRQEIGFLARYDATLAAADERFDARGSDLSFLMVGCIDHHNVVCIRRREPLPGRVPAALLWRASEEITAQTEHDLVDTSDDAHRK